MNFSADNQQTIKKLLILLGSFGVSLSAVFIRIATMPSLVLVFYRMLLTVVILLVPAVTGHRTELRGIPFRTLLCCILSGLFLTLHFVTYFQAVRETSVASAVLLTDAEVFFTGALGAVFFKERIGRSALIGILIAFLGCTLIAVNDAGGGTDMLRGDLLALIACVSMAGYTMMGRICRRDMSTTLYTLVVYTVTAIASFLILLAIGMPVAGWPRINLLAALGMAVFCTLLGHNVFSWGLKYLNAATISTLKLAEPVFSAILAAFLFSEIPGTLAILGSAAIIGGIWWYLKNSAA